MQLGFIAWEKNGVQQFNLDFAQAPIFLWKKAMKPSKHNSTLIPLAINFSWFVKS